jgi:DNA-directed RNA polymerase specialized sigma24 family protein
LPLTESAFNRLLEFLDPDRETAGRRYEQIQRKLVRFFEWRACSGAEELADATIDRVTRRLMEGEEIRATDPTVYFYGVARNVAREWSKANRQQAQSPAQLPPEQEAWPGQIEDVEQRSRCLDRCLGQLSPETRQLILEYYESRGQERIENRQRLAAKLQISQSALRLRAQRIRDHLETCVRRCVTDTS